ncbi:MAG: hypothetical protein H8E36_02200 [Rhodospirillaceae bacterium]|nr:hypothetical protein [Rhodospirillaceae bacterium]MBL6930553.1 hypothetical protein [Rhodospirillales bacterium]
METGVTTWNMNLLDIGAMYPFPGSEMIMAIIGIASWIIWHIIQMRAENKKLAKEEINFSDKAKLLSAMKVSNAETLNEALKSHEEGIKG